MQLVACSAVDAGSLRAGNPVHTVAVVDKSAGSVGGKYVAAIAAVTEVDQT